MFLVSRVRESESVFPFRSPSLLCSSFSSSQKKQERERELEKNTKLTRSLGSSDLNLPPIARNSSTPTAASQRTSALRHCRGTGVPAASSDFKFLRALREACPARAEETPTPRAPAAGARRGVAQERRWAKQVALSFFFFLNEVFLCVCVRGGWAVRQRRRSLHFSLFYDLFLLFSLEQ